jgi:hypothetical protein
MDFVDLTWNSCEALAHTAAIQRCCKTRIAGGYTPAIREFKEKTMPKPSPIRWPAQVKAWTGTLWVVVEFVAKVVKLWRDFRQTR